MTSILRLFLLGQRPILTDNRRRSKEMHPLLMFGNDSQKIKTFDDDENSVGRTEKSYKINWKGRRIYHGDRM